MTKNMRSWLDEESFRHEIDDVRIGYGHCYGMVYDAEMMRDKLRQREYVLNSEIPDLGSIIRFHLWNDFP